MQPSARAEVENGVRGWVGVWAGECVCVLYIEDGIELVYLKIYMLEYVVLLANTYIGLLDE